MILEEATKEAFGYYPSKCKPQSAKPIIAACEFCGNFKVTTKNYYKTFCNSCSMILGGKQKGRTFTEESKALMSVSHKGKSLGKNHPNYKGGKKMVLARKNAKRKRDLGYTLLLPLEEGEVGHHVTNEYVIGIFEEVHQKLGGGNSRENHRIKVLEWLKVNDKKKYSLVRLILKNHRTI